MARETSRDKCWNRTLSLVLSQGVVYKTDLTKGIGVSERTAGDVLNTMADMGWITREEIPGPKADKWRRGDDLPATLNTEAT